MFRVTIRDVLWLTVVVAMALTFWLGWSRDVSELRERSAAREDEIAAERDLGQRKLKELTQSYVELSLDVAEHKMREQMLQQELSKLPKRQTGK